MNRSTLKEVVVRVFSAQKALKKIKPSNSHLSKHTLGFHLHKHNIDTFLLDSSVFIIELNY